MRVPITWLREYVDLPNDTQEIADRLALLGFPVEEIVKRPLITGVVVGKITAQTKHPNADRLQVCTIDIGASEPLTIATAATNTAVGQVIPVATIGAQLPHLKIEPRKMRGIDSQGMLCSPDELALPPEWFDDGIMQLDSDIPLGKDVVEIFGLSDDVLDVEITSNRVDAMSVIGLARELSASYRVPLRIPSLDNPGTVEDPAGSVPAVTIESADCKRFVAQVFDRVRVQQGPAWMRIRLALAGQRPINNIVDVSNYVMLETGQPLHFYDAQHVAGHHFIVRDAEPSEKLVTLDDQEHELSPQALVIADERGILGLAGLMGGKSSEVTADTKSIVLESANFTGARVRRMSKQLGFRTEASSRNEKTLPLSLTDAGAARAAALLGALGAHAYRPHAFGADVIAATPIVLHAHEVERILGLRLDEARIASYLEALGCTVERTGGALSVTPPLWRRDLTITADLVEEVARMEGYDSIEAFVPSVPAHSILSTQYDLENKLAFALAALGYREVITYSLHGPQIFERARRAGVPPSFPSVEVLNPLSEDQRYLRYALGPGLLAYLARLEKPARVFEIGHVFTSDEGHVNESTVLTFGFTGEPLDEPDWRDSHFLRLKGDCEALIRTVTGCQVEASSDVRNALHPGKTAVLMHDGREVASIGRLDPRLERAYDARFPVYFVNMFLDKLPDYHTPKYRVPSKFPSTYRDLAVIVDLDVTAARIASVAQHAIGELCTDARVFDEYRGTQVSPNRKSVALRVTMQRFDATITDEEADAAIARTVAALRDELGGTIRE